MSEELSDGIMKGQKVEESSEEVVDVVTPQDQPQGEVEIEVAGDEGEQEEVREEPVVSTVSETVATPMDVPNAQVMNAVNPSTLINYVDGPRINPDDFTESVYHGRAIPVPARDMVQVPIVIPGPPNSVLEYTIESFSYDISFGVTITSQVGLDIEKTTEYVELKRVDSHLDPITGQILVDQVPCTVLLTFDNTYSFLTAKEVSYRVTISPPSIDEALSSRRRRAKASLCSVQEDRSSAESRLTMVISQRLELEREIEKLQLLIMEKNKNKLAAEKEESWLKKRIELRDVQTEMLNVRLESGWEDEVGQI